MWLIAFMVVCTVPLIIWGCVLSWRENQWNKNHEQKTA